MHASIPSIQQVRYFLVVAEEQSIGRAAARLQISQPSLSDQIRRLENRLGAPLFTRSSAGVELTEPGRAFLLHALRAIGELDSAVDAARSTGIGPTSTLTLGASMSALWEVVPQLLRACADRCPDLALAVSWIPTASLGQVVAAGTVDVGFAQIPERLPDLVYEAVRREGFNAAISAGLPLARPEGIDLRDLDGRQLVIWERAAAPGLYDEILDLLARAGARVDVREYPPEALLDGELVSSGKYIMLLPVCAPRFNPGLALVPVRDAPATATTWAFRRADDHSPALGSFLAVMRELARERNWLDQRGT